MSAAGRKVHALGLVLVLGTGCAAGLLAFLRPGLLQLNLDRSLETAAALIVGALLLLLSFRHPLAGLCALLVVIWGNLSEILVREHGLPSTLQLMLPALMFAILSRRLSQPRDAAHAPAGLLSSPGMLFALLSFAYVSVALASTTWAYERATANAAVEELLKAVLLGLVVAYGVDSALALRRTAWTLVITGAALSALSSFQALTSNWDQTFGGLARVKQGAIAGGVFDARATGPLADPNFYAQCLLVLVPLALSLALGTKARAPRVLAILVALVLVVGVVTTYSRGGALALAFALALMAWQERRRVRAEHLGWAAALGLIVLIAVPGLFLSRLETLSVLLPSQEDGITAQDSSVNKRKVLMGAAAAMALEHPLLGVGIGNFGDQFEIHADRVGAEARIYQDPGERAFPHSLYLEMLAETGLAGFLAFLVLALTVLGLCAGAARRFEERQDDAAAILTRALVVAIAGYLASSLILHGDYIRYLWVLFGMGVAAARASAAAR